MGIVNKTVIYQQSAFGIKKFVKFNTFVKQTNTTYERLNTN
jgi:hypothetical protein